MDDDMIINLYWERSESAIKETATKYGNYCTAIAMNILHNKEDSEECINDTYLNTWNTIPPQRPNNFMAFLGRIIRNLSFNKYKERRAKKRSGDEIEILLSELENIIPSGNNVEKDYETGSIAAIIDSFLDSIDSETRIVFVRRYWYSDSVKDIVKRFGISESKVKSILLRTRNKLKKYLEKEEANI
jgi:RNA polymerase sigma-70 factor (ECF subfamily)